MHEHHSEIGTLVTDVSAYELWNVLCPVLISEILYKFLLNKCKHSLKLPCAGQHL